MNAPCGSSFALLVILVAATSAWAGGQALGLRHPVLDPAVEPGDAARYEAAVERVMGMSEAEMLDFVPQWSYVQYCECPNCYGGVEGNGIFTWAIERPAEMKCRFCGTVYPNGKYPETETLTGQNLLGETVSFPYYKNPDNGVQHFLSTHLLALRRRWLSQQADALARAYVATGKEEYARRAAVILDRFAQRYPHYPVMQNLPRTVTFRPQTAPWPWDSGRWNFFHNNIPVELLPAYDMTYLSPEWDRLSQGRGYDARERLERDFLKPSCEEVMVRTDHVNNCVGYDVRSAALLGQVIGEPRYVHWAYYWMKRNLTEGFMRDGMWKEGTPAYHAMTVGGLTYAFEAVKGYSDPAGYQDGQDGTRYDGLDPDREFPFWARCKDAPNVIATPDGISAIVHDTHAYAREVSARTETVSSILPAVGHASLGRGRGPDQMQAQLHFSGGYGHQHYDNLNLMLWAKGQEMLPDVGYTWTQMRCWTTSAIGHNLVVVDRQDQRSNPSDGNLLAFFPGDRSDPDAPEVAVAEADGKLGYTNIKGLDLYHRLVVMVPVSAADAYLVDVFRVRGGALHDWALHGDADEDTTATCSLKLGEPRPTMLLPEEKWVEPAQEAHQYPPYGMLRDMRPGPVDGDFELEFRYGGERRQGYRLRMLPAGPGEVFLGRAPSVRRMGQGSNGDMRKGYDFWMPMMVLRRAGEAPLTSVFAAVHEPYAGEAFLGAVRALKLQPATDLATALEVRHGEAVDTIISAGAAAPFAEVTTETGITLRGKLGVVRQVDGKTVAAWLFEGEALSGKDFSVTAGAAGYDGALTGATRRSDGQAEDAFLTEAKLPPGDTLRGRWLIATYPSGMTQGYEISRVVTGANGETMIVTTEDHGLRVAGGKVEEAYAPLRKLEGQVTFHIGGMASVVRQEDGLMRAQATSPVDVTWPK